MASYTRWVDIPVSRAVMLGLVAGLVGGLFGIGGGVVVVPGLVLWLKFDQYKASGTSVATIVASAGAALLTFAGDGSVDIVRAALAGAAGVGGTTGTDMGAIEFGARLIAA